MYKHKHCIYSHNPSNMFGIPRILEIFIIFTSAQIKSCSIYAFRVLFNNVYFLCGRRKQAIQTASYVLWDCEALAALRFRHLGQSFYETRWLWGHLCQQDTALWSKCGAAECEQKGCTKGQKQSNCTGYYDSHPYVFYSILYICIHTYYVISQQ